MIRFLFRHGDAFGPVNKKGEPMLLVLVIGVSIGDFFIGVQKYEDITKNYRESIL